MVPKPSIRSDSVDLDPRTFRDISLGNKAPNVWTLDILNGPDLTTAMDYLRLNMKVPFGIGPNNSVYIIDDSIPTSAEIQYFNLPVTVSYNEYLNEVHVVEYYSENKYGELNNLVKDELEKVNVPVDESDTIQTPTLDGTRKFAEGDEFDILEHLLSSKQPYVELSNWLGAVSRNEHNMDLYDTLYTIWIRVMGDYTPPSNQYSSLLNINTP